MKRRDNKYHLFRAGEDRGGILKKTNVKIIGIFVCILFLGLLIPTAVAEKQINDQIQPTDFIHRRLMVFGHISDFIILNNIIIGHADLLIYYGKGILNLDRGIITDKLIIVKMAKYCHIWVLESDVIILGRCISLNYL
jgi:hypothetical protein